MQTPPTVDTSYRPLHQLAMGPLKAALMNCAIDAAVFDVLADFTPAHDVAGRLGTNPDNTRRFLDALATIDLVEKKNGRYRNRPLAAEFLVSGAPAYVGPLLKQTQSAGLNPLEQLGRLLRQGPDPALDPGTLTDEAIWAEEARASAGWVLAGAGGLAAAHISALPGFDGFDTMLDLGCGHGMFAIYILAAHPTLTARLLDRPAVLDAARPFVERYAMGSRVSYLPGDYLTDDIGDGYDLIWASATLNLAMGRLDGLLAKIHQALKPGGYFVSFQDGMTREYTCPDTMLGAVMPSMMMGMDYCFAQGAIAEAALYAGFSQVRSRTVATAIGDMDLDIARKAS